MRPIDHYIHITRKITLLANRLQEHGRTPDQALAEAAVATRLDLGKVWDYPSNKIADCMWVVLEEDSSIQIPDLDVCVVTKAPSPVQVVVRGWRWGTGILQPWPPPVWKGEVVWPRAEAKERKRPKASCVSRKRGNKFPLRCPRCGWAARHLITPFFDSPWVVWGGICSECCAEAEERFDQTGWPDYAHSNVQMSEKEAISMVKTAFGMKATRGDLRNHPQSELAIDTSQDDG